MRIAFYALALAALLGSAFMLLAGLATYWLLLVAILVMGGLVAEIILRIAARWTLYSVLPPNLHWELHPAPDAMPGVEGVAIHSTDELGIRGDRYTGDGRYNILTLGGSATHCAYLDNRETWPYLLQVKLNESPDVPAVWVGNAGFSGHGLVNHIYALQYFVPQFAIDAVIVMIGINELTPVLRHPARVMWGEYSTDQVNDTFIDSFHRRPLVTPGLSAPLPAHLALRNFVYRLLFWRVSKKYYIRVDQQAGRNYIGLRRQLQAAPVPICELPDLSAALDHYESLLVMLIAVARQQSVRLILATHPVLWHEHLSPEAEQRLWMGYYNPTKNVADRGRYAPSILAEGMRQFNDRLLKVCREQRLECIDLAAEVSGDERCFYDDCHLNEFGANRVAEVAAAYLKQAGGLEPRQAVHHNHRLPPAWALRLGNWLAIKHL
ncbi:MAG: SGNH/GDSL hydrolase family protein [Anaerolineae bacterium]|nr:SGNH/GDSL hydrolase family protein [Anaerolineae bacterium]